MTEPLRDESGNIPRNRGYEIRHLTNYDVIINTTFPNQQRLKDLFAVVQNGIPPTWRNIFTDEHKLIYRDSESNPRYIAKVRRHASIQFKDNEEYNYSDPHEKSFLLSENSLLNEIRLAPKIKELLQSEQVQALVRRYGFDDISFIEPMFGLIERSTGKKIMFYQWQEGYGHRENLDDDLYDPDHPLEQLGEGDTDFGRDLRKFFKKHKIDTFDLDTHQLIANIDEKGKKHLYLHDIDDYVDLTRLSS